MGENEKYINFLNSYLMGRKDLIKELVEGEFKFSKLDSKYLDLLMFESENIKNVMSEYKENYNDVVLRVDSVDMNEEGKFEFTCYVKTSSCSSPEGRYVNATIATTYTSADKELERLKEISVKNIREDLLGSLRKRVNEVKAIGGLIYDDSKL